MADLIIRNATLPDGRTGCDVVVTDGCIVDVAPRVSATATHTMDAGGYLLSPPFVDAHFHMDSTLSYGVPRVNQSGTLLEGIALWGELKPLLRQEALVDRARTRFGNRTIDKRSAAREILRILQGGGTLGILVDLNTQEREGIFVDFFGVKASTTFLVAKLALRTNSEVLPVFAPWNQAQQCFLLKIDEPLKIVRSGDEEEDVRRLTQALTSVVEKYVRRYPDQWLWIHRRWKTRPPGERGIYD